MAVKRKRSPRADHGCRGSCDLGCAERTVRDLPNGGELPGAAKIGRGWAFDEARMRQYITAKEHEAANPKRRNVRSGGVEHRHVRCPTVRTSSSPPEKH